MNPRIVLLLVLLVAISAPSQAEEDCGDDSPGVGSLVWKTSNRAIDLPILSITLDLDVHGIVGHATLVEEFTNPTGEVIEAEYVLPLPEHGSVHAMEMRIGERRIVSQVRKRAEARAIYTAAREEGKKAALVEQQRPNLFTTSVTGILPGETVVVRIEILDTLDYVDGELRLAFPLTYTPRYGTQACPDSAPATVAPPPRITIHATIDAGFPASSVRSPSHVLRTVNQDRGVLVEPIANPVAADRDFLLHIVPEKPPGASGTVFVEDRPEGRYALVMILPPAPIEGARGLPTETLFVVDVSGSMEGPSISAAREALLAALDRLRPDDTFNLLKFSDANESFRATAQPADEEHLGAARAWIRALHADGGTELVPALVRALELTGRARSADTTRSRRVILVTDGAVSNEEEAFTTVSARLGDTRLHILGIGAAPNRHLMRKLALEGRGACEFLGSADAARTQIDALFRRIERPVLSDIALAWEGAPPIDSYPERIPDLYAGEPLLVSARLGIEHPGTRLVLTARDEAGPIRETVEIGPSAPAQSGIAIAWARARIDALAEGLAESLAEGDDPEQVRSSVIAIAKEFGLATKYTSLVAVEETPSATPATSSMRIGSTPPSGSMLPQGGTLDPLFLRLGVLLAVAGSVLLLFGSRASRC